MKECLYMRPRDRNEIDCMKKEKTRKKKKEKKKKKVFDCMKLEYYGLHAHIRKMHNIQEVSCVKKCKSLH